MHTGHLFMRSWWVLALRGLAAIAFGAITLAWPGVTVLSLLMVFAAMRCWAAVLPSSAPSATASMAATGGPCCCWVSAAWPWAY